MIPMCLSFGACAFAQVLGRLGNKCPDLGLCAQMRGPVCRSETRAQERGLCVRVWRDVCLGKGTMGPRRGRGQGNLRASTGVDLA